MNVQPRDLLRARPCAAREPPPDLAPSGRARARAAAGRARSHRRRSPAAQLRRRPTRTTPVPGARMPSGSGHAWVDGRKNDADLDAFAERIRGTGIQGPVRPRRAAGAQRDTARRPATHGRGGWSTPCTASSPAYASRPGSATCSPREGPDGLKPHRGAPATAVVGSARQILDAGFDGVHFDLEPLHSGDGDYLVAPRRPARAYAAAQGHALRRRPPDRPAARPRTRSRARSAGSPQVVVAEVLRRRWPDGSTRSPSCRTTPGCRWRACTAVTSPSRPRSRSR